jgi:hypothetical protein
MQLLDGVTGVLGIHARPKWMMHRSSSSTNTCMPLSKEWTNPSIVKMQFLDTYQAVS